MSRRGTLLAAIGLISMLTVAWTQTADNTEIDESQVLVIRPVQKETARVIILDQVHAASTLLPVVDQEDIRPKDRELLDRVLRWMPPLCRNHLEHLIVRYDSKAERGQATSSAILLRGGMSSRETAAVLIHECGHVIDLGVFQGTESAGESKFPDGEIPTYSDDLSVKFYAISWQNSFMRKSSSAKTDFVSGYAMEDPWEDLAESIAYYALHEKAFRERAEKNDALKAKLLWVETYVFGPAFKTAPSDSWDGEIVWDVTKMEHGLTF